ncbi:YbbR family protein [Thermaerobacter marianensis DSM 12885]|uniref:YbbR family protein n=1 Tax=Thermaerobacter marianensis (strain ATCC 700841 / DSM 12885 / JCM 10246 / 7p75a) TaxID=644966 RepID=E6SM32_THEM7|nr:CdaR family protein [Thermaerobacter marianensis]ADU50362.1 YbbR family protein [Thermaerobacter marianensis DSM 12885]
MERLFENENRLKILSVILAIILWFGVMSSQNPDQARTVYDVEVVPEGLDPGLAVLSLEPHAVDVTFGGPPEFLQDLAPRDARVTVDVSGVGPGETRRPVTVIPARGRLRVVRVSPQYVTVRLEPRMEKTVPVELQLNGEPSPDYMIENPTVSVEQVTVSGARSLVEQVARVVASVAVSGIQSTIAHSVTLVPVDASGRPVEAAYPQALVLEPPTAQVTVPVVFMPRKTVPVQARLEGAPAQGFEIGNIAIEPAEVTVRAREERILQELDFLQTEPVDISGLDRTVTREVALAPPEGVVVVGGPPAVRVTIEIRPVKEAPGAGGGAGTGTGTGAAGDGQAAGGGAGSGGS